MKIITKISVKPHDFKALILFFLLVSYSITSVRAEQGSEHQESEEAQHLELSDQTLKESEIFIEKVSAKDIEIRVHLNGKIIPNENKVAHLMSRFSGIVKDAKKGGGESVKKGDLLAIIESNQNLQAFELKAPFDGIIISRHATIGELVNEASDVFIVADLSEVWADFFIFGSELHKVKVGQTISIRLPESKSYINSKITYVSSIVEETTQSKFARIVIPNEQGYFSPGAFITGELTIDKVSVPLAVKSSAIQIIEGKSTIFLRHEGKLIPTEARVGRNNGEYAEILSGVSLGDEYAAGKSFVLKAELEKGEAEHGH